MFCVESQTSVTRGATSLYAVNVVMLLANTVYFLILTNVLTSTLNVGVITALNITIWLLVTTCILAQPPGDEHITPTDLVLVTICSHPLLINKPFILRGMNTRRV